MPRPDKRTVAMGVVETLERLATAPVDERSRLLVNWDEIEGLEERGVETELNKMNMITQLQRTVDEIFTGPSSKLSIEDRWKPFFPSTSANYIASRSGGGTVGELLTGDVLTGLREPGGLLKADKVERKEEEDKIENETYAEMEVIDIETEQLEKRFEKLWIRMAKKALGESDKIELVGLAESLKVRVISKQQPYSQAVLRPIWKKMHNILRKHKVFSLIGCPQTEQRVQDGLGWKLEDDEEYLSGDYADATNRLKSWVSEAIGEQILKRMEVSEAEKEIFFKNLTRQTVGVNMKDMEVLGIIKERVIETFIQTNGREPTLAELSEKFAEAVERGQKNGQTMGSVISFPILCIANATMSRWALELAYGRRIPLVGCNLLINGDDVAIRGKKSTYSFWKAITAYGGLEESIGKTFRSRQFVNINSTNFLRGEEPHSIIKVDLQNKPYETVNRETGENEQVVQQNYFNLVQYYNIGLN
jgi:hypothetical protein